MLKMLKACKSLVENFLNVKVSVVFKQLKAILK